jgi:hypothetical protein
LAVANDQQALNHTVSGIRVRSKIVPAVTDVRCEHAEHLSLQSPSRRRPHVLKAAGPAQPLGVVKAVRVGREPSLVLADGPRVVQACTEMGGRLWDHSRTLLGLSPHDLAGHHQGMK